MSTGFDRLPCPTSSPGSTLAVDFDTEFRLLEDRISARLQGRGLLGRLRTATHLLGAACRDLATRRS